MPLSGRGPDVLELDTRTLLLDALRPPAGYGLDIAVGTTFTLDLTALLAVPLAAAMRDGSRSDSEDAEESAAAEDRTEALDLFETVRRLADRVVVFAQAGATAVPKRYRPLYACIENSVVPVRRPRPGRIFHPKLWALRFRRDDGALHHRVVVLTRNLTFDRCWDVMVTADEESEAGATFDTQGLLEALRYLPDLVGDGHENQLALVDDLADTLTRARLPLPARARSGSFHALGWDGTATWPFDPTCRDALAVSPYLSASSAERFLHSATHGATAVARPTAFDGVESPLKAEKLVPLPEAEPADDGDGTTTLRGLHAKVFVQDRWGGPYSLWIGSANLTDAAFDGNAEMLVRIDGDRGAFGTAAVLGTERRGSDRSLGLRDLLTAYEPGDPGTEEPEDGDLQAIAIDVAAAGVTLGVEPSDSADTWDVALRAEPASTNLELDARLLTLPSPLPVQQGSARWTGLATTSITPYVVLGVSDGDRRHEVLVRAQLEGDPGHRRSAVLASCMASPEDFLRYVLALLGDDDPIGADVDGGGAWATTALRAWLDPERVLEGLLLAASRSPQRLEQLQRLVVELERTERGRSVIPEDFRTVWEPVWAATEAKA